MIWDLMSDPSEKVFHNWESNIVPSILLDIRNDGCTAKPEKVG